MHVQDLYGPEQGEASPELGVGERDAHAPETESSPWETYHSLGWHLHYLQRLNLPHHRPLRGWEGWKMQCHNGEMQQCTTATTTKTWPTRGKYRDYLLRRESLLEIKELGFGGGGGDTSS